ncbi:hypothetical protein HK103_007387 [Boothiomyces macroporosus]|uniref:Protein kinase domain-containing protein n=1 Tax=Boothiomyces macroporosus TaxID=261099 RepID=A0AAD5Y5N6_9FUNG|nr:hypothetical protein HK103_007387 [Boothiomyces macroporosus]
MSQNQNSQETVEFSLMDFELLQIIGQGAFGKVRIVEQIKTKRQFALKYVDKLECIRSHSTRNIFRERYILQTLNHHYIINLRYCFQDDENLFFVLDLATGGDLSLHLRKLSFVKDDTLTVWAAELGSAINYIHSKHMLHRDLKPENILVDGEGHLMITDFNVSVNLRDKTPKSRSGTLAYVAPEMCINKAYRYSVDWWSYGINPFKERSDDRTLEAIAKKVVEYPKKHKQTGEKIEGEELRVDFISKFLERNVELRYGSGDKGHGFNSQIKTHPYLAGIDWDLLNQKKLKPAYTPKPNMCFEPNIAVCLDELMAGDKLGTKVEKAKRKNEKKAASHASLSSIFSGLKSKFSFSKSSINIESKSNATLPAPLLSQSSANVLKEKPAAKKSKKELELDYMMKYFIPYDFENPEHKRMEMPPHLEDLIDGGKKLNKTRSETNMKISKKDSDIAVGEPGKKSLDGHAFSPLREQFVVEQKNFQNVVANSPLRENLELKGKLSPLREQSIAE